MCERESFHMEDEILSFLDSNRAGFSPRALARIFGTSDADVKTTLRAMLRRNLVRKECARDGSRPRWFAMPRPDPLETECEECGLFDCVARSARSMRDIVGESDDDI